MRVGKIGVAVIGLIPFNVYGECTPTPDCADMGYTETSCSGSFVRCPFDTSKLFCAPCDSKFQYTCSGDNITGGIGSACGGKYVSCECATNYIFDNGSCICPEIAEADCLVGAIYYPDGKCSNDYIICQNPVGVVVKDNALVMSWRIGSIQWGGYGDIADLTSYSNEADAKADFNGRDNTAKIITHFGENVDTTLHAGVFCYKYAPTGMESSKGQWYLPAQGELYDYVYSNYDTLNNVYITYLGITGYSDYWFWSSSEQSNFYAWSVNSSSGVMYYLGKNGVSSVSCFLAL